MSRRHQVEFFAFHLRVRPRKGSSSSVELDKYLVALETGRRDVDIDFERKR